MPNVLFLCNANQFRSVIAAECLRIFIDNDHIPGNWVVGSAGTWAKEGLAPIPQAIKFAKSKGLVIENYRSREVNQELLDTSDLVIVMSEGQREALHLEFQRTNHKVHLLSEVCEGVSYDIPDPVRQLDETMEEMGTEICRLITSGYARICDKAQQMYYLNVDSNS